MPANPIGATDAENWANFLSCGKDDCKKLSKLGPVTFPTNWSKPKFSPWGPLGPGTKLLVDKGSPSDEVK